MRQQIFLFLSTCLITASMSCTSIEGNMNPTSETINCIGTTYFNIIDMERPEIFTEDPNDFRDILIKIWYPAVKSANQNDPVNIWFQTSNYPLPSANISASERKILQIKSESFLNAQPKAGSFPVILYSHGYYSQPAMNQLLIEHLVNEGYIIVSVTHNHQASMMVTADGKANSFNHEARSNDFFLSNEADISGEELNQELRELQGKELLPDQKDRVYTLMEWAEGDHLWIDYWVEDFNSALTALSSINNGEDVSLYNSKLQADNFIEKFDLQKIMALGSSMGGIVSLDFSNQNANCIGAVNMDAVHYSLKKNGAYTKPYMYLHAGEDPLPDSLLVLEQQTAPAYLVGVEGAKHVDFTDGTVIMREWFDLGTIKGPRMIELMNQSITLFFNFCLDSSNKPALEEYLYAQKELSIHQNTFN